MPSNRVLRLCMQPILDDLEARIGLRGSRIMLQSELLGLLEKTADAAFCVNEQGEICSWNAAAEKLFGYSSAEAIGKSCQRLLRCLLYTSPSPRDRQKS